MKEIKKIVTKDIGFGTGYDEDDLLEYMEGEARCSPHLQEDKIWIT